MPPVIPAAVAIAGSIWGLFNLTLGQEPSNALPHWSPVFGWSASLGSLALASVLAWIGLVRRKCPECGCTQMLDAMEEEGLTASERLAAQKAAVDEALLALGRKTPGEVERDLRAQIEAELRAAQGKENADKRAMLEKELREDIERRVRTEHERQSSENERVLRKRLEEELRPQIETKLRAEIEMQLRAAQVTGVPSATSPGAAKAVTPAPVTTARAIAASTSPAAKPVTPAPVTTAKAIAASTVPAARPVTPAPVTAARAIAASTAPAAKPVTPAPITAAKAIAASTAPQSVAPTPASQAEAKTATPAPRTFSKTAQPAEPHDEVVTAPLAMIASVVRLGAGTPAPAEPGQSAPPPTTRPAIDGHERAKRRARVILSDLSAYHRDELLKAARAADPKHELGTLWRDAVISYNEVASPEIRSVTNYLEEELDRYLVRLRSD